MVTCAFPVAVHAKRESAMCRYVVLNEVTDVEGLKGSRVTAESDRSRPEHFPAAAACRSRRSSDERGRREEEEGAAEVGSAAKGKRPTAATEKAGAKRTREEVNAFSVSGLDAS